ncbi:DUF4476 domain-containing protein [Chloropicon primus]|nr:DUF4476 domain-containing protein [Chloropicon primus]
MGAASSITRNSDAPIIRAENGVTLFQVEILTQAFAKRTDKALLEISKFGIRILDRSDNQVIKAIAMSLIHSWSPEARSIVFVCTNGNMDLYSIELSTTQCEEILSCLQQIVSQVLSTRKEQALNETEVIDLLSSLNKQNGSSDMSQLEVLKSQVEGRYLTSEKAFLVASSFSDTFDKMEATLFLQSHLVDQNKFSKILETFESEERQNIWHRIYVKLY